MWIFLQFLLLGLDWACHHLCNTHARAHAHKYQISETESLIITVIFENDYLNSAYFSQVLSYPYFLQKPLLKAYLYCLGIPIALNVSVTLVALTNYFYVTNLHAWTKASYGHKSNIVLGI